MPAFVALTVAQVAIPVALNRWNQELFRVLAAPEIRAKLADLGMSVVPAHPSSEFADLIRRELDQWGRFVKASGLRPG